MVDRLKEIIKEKKNDGAFLVGGNNRGKTKILKELKKSTKSEIIEIMELENEFRESYKKSGANPGVNWYNYTCNNAKLISKFIPKNIEIKYQEKDLENDGVIGSIEYSNFIISENGEEYTALVSTGYMSLFLLSSYLHFKKIDFETKDFLLLDEVDLYLGIDNKKMVIDILKRILPENKFIMSTHSPFTLESIDNCLIYNVETKKYYFTDDFNNLESIIKIMKTNYISKYRVSEKFEKLSNLYKEGVFGLKDGDTLKVELLKIFNKKTDEELKIKDIKAEIEKSDKNLTYKENILLNSLIEIIGENK